MPSLGIVAISLAATNVPSFPVDATVKLELNEGQDGLEESQRGGSMVSLGDEAHDDLEAQYWQQHASLTQPIEKEQDGSLSDARRASPAVSTPTEEVDDIVIVRLYTDGGHAGESRVYRQLEVLGFPSRRRLTGEDNWTRLIRSTTTLLLWFDCPHVPSITPAQVLSEIEAFIEEAASAAICTQSLWLRLSWPQLTIPHVPDLLWRLVYKLPKLKTLFIDDLQCDCCGPEVMTVRTDHTPYWPLLSAQLARARRSSR